ncbi:MAG: aliphatic sulfonate ABC transporter substrate-binding protein [Treponema sp.]|nr:aliphatic sulfonate ABC transporter substrate-binding protein [Treponema sp.]
MISITGCKKGRKLEARSVRVAIQPSAAFIPLYIARYTKSLENVLAEKNVTIIWQDFESGPSINESLFADLSDIGLIGDVPTVLALEKSNRMKMVGVPARGPNAYAMLVRKDDNSINNINDLKGKKIATVFGSTGHNFSKKLLEKTGIGFEGVEFCNISAGDAEYALASKSVDAVVIWEPNITRLVDKGLVKILAQGEDINLRGTNGFVVREEYLAQNKDIISMILKEYENSAGQIETINQEYQAKLAQALNVSPQEILSIAQKYDYSVAITQEDKASLQDTISFLVTINNLTSQYQIDSCIDNSCYEE